MKNTRWSEVLLRFVVLLAGVGGCLMGGAAYGHEVQGRRLPRQLVIPQVQPREDGRGGAVAVVVTGVGAHVQLNEHVSTTTLLIDLRNRTSVTHEAELLLPVPRGAVIRGFDFQGSGSEPSAKVLARGEAQRVYDEIVRRTKDPALMQFVGQALIKTSVFPVVGGGTQRVKVVYETVLDREGNRVDYVLPRSQSVGYRVPWRVTAEISTADRGLPIGAVYSPSHRIETVRGGSDRVMVKLGREARTTPGAFRLSFIVDRDEVAASLMTYPDPESGGGYFLLLAGSNGGLDVAGERWPADRREIILTLDCSGSMRGEKLEQLKRAALGVIESLGGDDRFNIVSFGQSVRVFASGPVRNTRANALAGRRYIKSLVARGGTNTHDALVETLRQGHDKGALPLVLFITDGLPTVGRTSEAVIRRLASDHNPHRRRIFTVGLGADVNTPLLENLAASTRAGARFVLRDEDIAVAIHKTMDRLKRPVLASPVLRVPARVHEVGRGSIVEVFPEPLGDLYENDRLVIVGRYQGTRSMTLVLSGYHRGREYETRVTLDPGKASVRHDYVPRLWASKKIAALTDRIRGLGAEANRTTHPELVDLVAAIVELSKRFGILTEYTAFLATEGTDLGNQRAVLETAQREFYDKAIRVRSGLASVAQESNRMAQKGAARLNPLNAYLGDDMVARESSVVQQVGGRAFYLKSGRWVDSNLVDRVGGMHRKVAVGSGAYRDLVGRLAVKNEQGALAIRGEVLIMIDGETYLIDGVE